MIKKIVSLLGVLFLSFVMVGCDGGGNTTITPDADFYEESRQAMENGEDPSSGSKSKDVKTDGPTKSAP